VYDGTGEILLSVELRQGHVGDDHLCFAIPGPVCEERRQPDGSVETDDDLVLVATFVGRDADGDVIGARPDVSLDQLEQIADDPAFAVTLP